MVVVTNKKKKPQPGTDFYKDKDYKICGSGKSADGVLSIDCKPSGIIGQFVYVVTPGKNKDLAIRDVIVTTEKSK